MEEKNRKYKSFRILALRDNLKKFLLLYEDLFLFRESHIPWL